MQNRTSMRKRNWNISSQEYSRYLRVTPFDPKSHTGYIIHAIDSIAPLQTLVRNIVEHVVIVHVDRVHGKSTRVEDKRMSPHCLPRSYRSIIPCTAIIHLQPHSKLRAHAARNGHGSWQLIQPRWTIGSSFREQEFTFCSSWSPDHAALE